MEIRHNRETEERRCARRLSVKKSDAIAVLRPKPLMVGQILDISKFGLSLESISDFSQRSEPTEIDIYFVGEELVIRGLACRCVYTKNAERPDFSMVFTKRRGIEFQNVNALQLSQLELFLDLHGRDQSS